jgi:hypothetical protein
MQHRETLGQSIRLQERHNTSKMLPIPAPLIHQKEIERIQLCCIRFIENSENCQPLFKNLKASCLLITNNGTAFSTRTIDENTDTGNPVQPVNF